MNQSTRLNDIYRMVLILAVVVDIKVQFSSLSGCPLKSDVSRSTLAGDFPWSKGNRNDTAPISIDGKFYKVSGKIRRIKNELTDLELSPKRCSKKLSLSFNEKVVTSSPLLPNYSYRAPLKA